MVLFDSSSCGREAFIVGVPDDLRKPLSLAFLLSITYQWQSEGIAVKTLSFVKGRQHHVTINNSVIH